MTVDIMSDRLPVIIFGYSSFQTSKHLTNINDMLFYAGGVFHINLVTFFLAAMVSRGARFFLLGGLISWFGPAIGNFIDRYFNLLTILFIILLLGGFWIVNYTT